MRDERQSFSLNQLIMLSDNAGAVHCGPRIIAQTLALSSGTRLGPYEVTSALGAGGPASARFLQAMYELRRALAEAQRSSQT